MAMTDDEARAYFERIAFDADAARRGDIGNAFYWYKTAQGDEFWMKHHWSPTRKGRAILAAMVKEYERLHEATTTKETENG